MEGLSYQCRDDIEYLNKGSKNTLKFRFGSYKHQSDLINNIISQKLKSLSAIGNGKKGKYVGTFSDRILIHGIFYMDQNGNYHLEQESVQGKNQEERDYILDVSTHEWGHLYNTASIEALAKNRGLKKVGNVFYENACAGLLIKYDCLGRKEKTMGRMFIETLNEILSKSAARYYRAKENGTTRYSVDDMIFSTVDEKNMADSEAYKRLLPITRLMLIAFSNESNPNAYEILANSGVGNVLTLSQMADGTDRYMNDFIYGINCDPTYVVEEYEKIMGAGSFESLCDTCDKIFKTHTEGKRINVSDVKKVMTQIPIFANRRSQKMLEEGKITKEQREFQVGRFNKVWNEMSQIYGSYFTKEELQELYAKSLS